jgi:hypothetical protein
MSEKLISNKVKCLKCGDIIESSSVHDLKSCSCGNVFVDGGLDYRRRLWKDDKESFEELSEFEE